MKGVKHTGDIYWGGLEKRNKRKRPAQNWFWVCNKLIFCFGLALLWTVSPSACLGLNVSSLILCFPPFTSIVSIIVSIINCFHAVSATVLVTVLLWSGTFSTKRCSWLSASGYKALWGKHKPHDLNMLGSDAKFKHAINDMASLWHMIRPRFYMRIFFFNVPWLAD